jgi:hypothetical protein
MKFPPALRREWIFLIPVLAATFVAFLRFPLLQNDDHLKVVRFIAREWSWPPVPVNDRNDQAQHTLLHHTLSAAVYRGLARLAPGSSLVPARGVQAISLAYAVGIVIIVALVARRLIASPSARALAFLAFGSFTGWVRSSVTIDNDMAMGFWGSLALLQAVRMMQSPAIPRLRAAAGLGLLIGIAAFTKATASVMIPVAALSLLARCRLKGDPFRPLLGRALLLVLLWAPLAGHNYYRYYRDTGHLVTHQSFHQRPPPGVAEERWDYFSFRFREILRRPFRVAGFRNIDERLTAADYSFWSKLYIYWWCLGSLPLPPNPWATSGLYAAALIPSLCALAGLFRAFFLIRRDPAWLPVIGWLLIGIAGMLTGSCFIPDVSYGAFINPRFLNYAAPSQVAFFALGFQAAERRWPRSLPALAALVLLQLLFFWWLLLSGPFYSFWETWPSLNLP